jgi:hypothetical protein
MADDLRQLLDRLDAQEHRVRKRAVLLTALPIAATVVCLVLISVVVSRSMRQLADAERRQATAMEAALQAESAQQAAEGRTALAVQELQNIRAQIEEAQQALAKMSSSSAASARVLGNVSAAAARSVREIDSVTAALTVPRTEIAGLPNSPDAAPAPEGPAPAAGAPAVRPRAELIGALYSPQAAARIRAYNELMAAYARDPALVPELLDMGRRELARTPLNADGIFNTLVVLSHVNRDRLSAHRDDVRAFVADVKRVGGKATNARADIVLQRLPR